MSLLLTNAGNALDGLDPIAAGAEFAFNWRSGVWADNGTTPASDGGPVAQWDDRSGNYSALFDDIRPTFSSTLGLSAATVNQRLIFTPTDIGLGLTAFTVYAVGDFASGLFDVFGSTVALPGGSAWLFNTTTVFLTDANNSAIASVAMSGLTGTHKMFRLRCNGVGHIYCKVNGQAEVELAGTLLTSVIFDTLMLRPGADASGAANSFRHIALFYDDLVTNGMAANVEAYFAAQGM